MADQSTIVEIPLTASTRAVTIPFDYLTRSAVVLTVKRTDDVTYERALVLTDNYRFTSGTQVTLNADYSSLGDLLEVKRHTPATRLVDFRDGSVLTANSLNISQLQAIHIAEEGRFEITTEIREATADAQRFARNSAASAAESLTWRNSTQAIWDGILNSIEAAGDAGTLGYLATPTGLSAIGGFISFDALRLTKPQYEGQRVRLESYFEGKALGGGEFIGHTVTAADDGGTIASGPTHHWKRIFHNSELNITHFGALMDGVTDDMQSAVKMHNWSRTIDATFGPGIVLPAGKTAMSTFDFGDAEIPAFKMRGPTVSYGRIPSVMIIPFNKTTPAYMFRFKARRMEVACIYVNGAGSKCGFVENTVTRGDYCRIDAVQARNLTGRCFHVFDTIDTAVTQCYSTSGKASFFRTDWSNESPGAWDHPTAILISDCNFEAHTGEYAVSCIRAGQSVMRNCWFDRNENGFDVSQGGWILENITQENSVNPSGAQYAKLVKIRNRFAQGKGLDNTVSGYDPAQDSVANGGKGKMPEWVNSGYENGDTELALLGFKNTGSMSYGYESSAYKVSNMTANQVWVDVGSFTLGGQTGETCNLEFVGAGHFDAASGTPRPGGTNFGSGKTTIMMQQKDSDAKSRASWYSHGASPIMAVRVAMNRNRPRVYVLLAQYTGPIAMTVHTSSRSNFEGGQHFYHNILMNIVDEATATAGGPLIPATWNASNGRYGMGMDLDAGKFAVDGPGLISNNASSHFPLQYNGTDILLPVQPSPLSTRVQRVSRAALPKATENPYGVVLVTDAVTGNGVTQWRLAFCDGSNWYTADGGTNLGAGSVTA